MSFVIRSRRTLCVGRNKAKPHCANRPAHIFRGFRFVSMDEILQSVLAERRAQNLYRERKVVASAQGAEVFVDGKKYLNFCSNDYLGLANHPAIIAAFKKAADEYGVGSGASHLVCGHTK